MLILNTDYNPNPIVRGRGVLRRLAVALLLELALAALLGMRPRRFAVLCISIYIYMYIYIYIYIYASYLRPPPSCHRGVYNTAIYIYIYIYY